MVFKIEGWIDVPEKGKSSHIGEEIEAEIETRYVNQPFIVRAIIGSPGFLSDATIAGIENETTEYLDNEVDNAEEEIKTFCEDLKVVGCWNKVAPTRFDIDGDGIIVYTPYLWRGNSNKMLNFHGQTLKEALQKALEAHRKQDKEIEEFDDDGWIEIRKNVRDAQEAQSLSDAWQKVARKREWFLRRKMMVSKKT